MSKHTVAAWLPLLIKELRSVTLTVHTPLNLFETQTMYRYKLNMLMFKSNNIFW